MQTMTTETLTHAIVDIEYLQHGERTMMMRHFRPTGTGPFPVILDLHGGAWNLGNPEDCTPRDEVLAKAGIAAAAIDFRHAEDGYPSSLIDINYAVRWLKTHAEDLQIDINRIGLVGQSSGGHLAMLAAMRPRDSRYASIKLDSDAPPVDATVNCVGMLWPVINPLSRYRHALRSRSQTNLPSWVGDIPEHHDTYWRTEEAMAEGNPMLALENGEGVETPPALWIQGTSDEVHDYRDTASPLDLNEPQRFAANYHKVGGKIDIVYVENAKQSDHASTYPLVSFLKHQFALEN
jgi:acetyl esterase